VSVGITAEEIARGDFNAVLMSLGPTYTRHFLGEADPAQLARWLPGLETGESILGLCLTEPGAGSDMGAMEATAVRHGDGFRINGIKNSVSFLNADVFYIFARTDPQSTGWRGISAFLVPRDAPGMSLEAYDDLGCRAVPRGIVRMKDVEVGADAMVGKPDVAFAMISHFFDINRAIIGLKCVGAALQTLDETVVYTKQRQVFGGPLSRNQGVAFAVAEAYALLEMVRWQCYRVLWMRDREIDCRDLGAMVKWFAPKTAVEVIHECLLFHGHYGYSKALPIQQRLRDVLGWQIGDGPPEVMKMIIARNRFGKDAFAAPMRHAPKEA
jgi:cyclohexanecarboxyl-CoA dehydrogenase